MSRGQPFYTARIYTRVLHEKVCSRLCVQDGLPKTVCASGFMQHRLSKTVYPGRLVQERLVKIVRPRRLAQDGLPGCVCPRGLSKTVCLRRLARDVCPRRPGQGTASFVLNTKAAPFHTWMLRHIARQNGTLITGSECVSAYR